MRLLVTGAGGMLGQDVASAARATGDEVVALARAELDVTDAGACARAVADVAPDALVNCAAWTDVDGAEADANGAFAVNALGAGNLARAAAAAGARLVHVSTDYVFEGERPPDAAPYVESDAPGPRSVYGASKRAGEEAIAAAPELSYAIVRSSWLFGAGGPNFVATMLRLATAREEVSVVTDQIGLPTPTVQLAPALLELARGEQQGIVHLAGAGAPISWHDFAVEIYRQAATGTRVLPCTTAEMPRPAPRPAFSALASERPDAPLLPPWQEGLATYLATRGVHA